MLLMAAQYLRRGLRVRFILYVISYFKKIVLFVFFRGIIIIFDDKVVVVLNFWRTA